MINKIGKIILFIFSFIPLYAENHIHITLVPFSGLGMEYKYNKNLFGIAIETPSDIWYLHPYYDKYKDSDNIKIFIKNTSQYIFRHDSNIKYHSPDMSLYWENYFYQDRFFYELRMERYSSSEWKIDEVPILVENPLGKQLQQIDDLYKEFSYKVYFPAYYRAGISLGYNFLFNDIYFFKISIGISIVDSSIEFKNLIYFPDVKTFLYYDRFFNYDLVDFYKNELLLKNDLKRVKIPYNIMLKMIVGYVLF